MITRLVGAMDPVGLDELDDRAALRHRLDNKYLIPEPALWSLLDEMQTSFSVLEIDRERTFAYESVYLDSSTFDLHRAHVQGRRLRYKIRTRSYGDGQLCFAEIKLKGRMGSTVKIRQRLSPDQHALVTPGLLTFIDTTLLGQYGVAPGHDLVPAVKVTYDRTTLMRRDGAERVTIDRELDVGHPDGRRAGRLRRGLVLLEVKSTDGRGVADQMLKRRHHRPTSLSKYGVGVVLTHPAEPHGDLRRIVGESFTVATEPAAA